jgi:uncharacterized protein
MDGVRMGVAVAVALGGAATAADAASVRCRSPRLNAVEQVVCRDAQLAKLDQDTDRKVRALLPRLSYGQYLGLRYWQSRVAEARDECGPQTACLGAQYRAQQRFLDGLQQCLDRGGRRRTCWRAMHSSGSAALPR